ncbi:MAG: amino acid ABC transporter permease [Rhodospirillaceae bacterium]|jgi:general L-amino acid transport system permease protein|nr:amino acid ABC transporter permease [Rhodospirillales bacterium]MBT3904552.1 amino acid ABC transporter permease [Rhodospirillaceae bacterium]MBT4702875.1 amino acid ABC transporter permease [Rhodospirillaceae bacterium]MBT5033990.1 amino acid ABC transporter permease [Rhodospirillaceae bacterium]MBT6218214.1 amino acid ABC transporter permease [Rhodospirillaceae bacterium]
MAEEYLPGKHPDLPPPNFSVGPAAWVRQNLFSSYVNTSLTLLGAYLIYLTVPPLVQWALIDADFIGESRKDCGREGACWVFIEVWMKQLMYGRYPEGDLWRINLGYLILVAGLVWMMIPGLPRKGWVGAFLTLGYPVVAFVLFSGGSFGLASVETSIWGGLFLTLVIAVTGIAASLPLGILMALGRRSNLPVIRSVAIIFIEFWRGIPLITVLFMSSVMFPLFLPEGMNFDKLLRALAGVTLFASAYMAEVVRGGLQAVPQGQVEAAHALGLGYWRTMWFIVLPQALKMVIPGIVNSFIALFKDTTLVLIIGLFDFLGVVQMANTNPHWLGFSVEGYVFAAFIFWLFCFSMSRYSQHLEVKLATGNKG